MLGHNIMSEGLVDRQTYHQVVLYIVTQAPIDLYVGILMASATLSTEIGSTIKSI